MARRSWARNANAMSTADEFNATHGDFYHITMPNLVDDDIIASAIQHQGD